VNGSASFPFEWDTSNPAAYGYTLTTAPRKTSKGSLPVCVPCPKGGMGTSVAGEPARTSSYGQGRGGLRHEKRSKGQRREGNG